MREWFLSNGILPNHNKKCFNLKSTKSMPGVSPSNPSLWCSDSWWTQVTTRGKTRIHTRSEKLSKVAYPREAVKSWLECLVSPPHLPRDRGPPYSTTRVMGHLPSPRMGLILSSPDKDSIQARRGKVDYDTPDNKSTQSSTFGYNASREIDLP